MDAVARIEALEAENDRLRARVEQLEGVAGLTFVAPRGWGLTTKEERLLEVLLSRDALSKDSLMAALYCDRHTDDLPELKIVDVFVCKLRKKLAPYGITIETLWGRGYAIAEPMKAKVRQATAA